ncbi:hypothetical protein [Noviherbaspirillum sp. UKPF54]|uniref:hypothetical protein n=1 Tax=Noviherbaspirillum sp. UKPF54 TaxID=2601898 RepID=UPI0011B1A987|nr:hypothetical protein [Noviherbaspirillum sp. UKPF54]QDZ26599.1 hypothetical protein FAY22_00610 [Noviherbaspirillum sp. UKPF54]
MKRVVDGKTYDTETASEICQLPCNAHAGDFRWHETYLFQTKNGRFFLAGCGGPLTMWAKSVEGNGKTSGSGLRPISPEEARLHMEEAECSTEEFDEVGLAVEEA